MTDAAFTVMVVDDEPLARENLCALLADDREVVVIDGEVLGTAFERWMASGISMTAMETDDVGRHLSEVLAVLLAHPQIDVPDLTYDPRGEPWH